MDISTLDNLNDYDFSSYLGRYGKKFLLYYYNNAEINDEFIKRLEGVGILFDGKNKDKVKYKKLIKVDEPMEFIENIMLFGRLNKKRILDGLGVDKFVHIFLYYILIDILYYEMNTSIDDEGGDQQNLLLPPYIYGLKNNKEILDKVRDLIVNDWSFYTETDDKEIDLIDYINYNCDYGIHGGIADFHVIDDNTIEHIENPRDYHEDTVINLYKLNDICMSDLACQVSEYQYTVKQHPLYTVYDYFIQISDKIEDSINLFYHDPATTFITNTLHSVIYFHSEDNSDLSDDSCIGYNAYCYIADERFPTKDDLVDYILELIKKEHYEKTA